jgi:hypothetical protein
MRNLSIYHMNLFHHNKLELLDESKKSVSFDNNEEDIGQ